MKRLTTFALVTLLGAAFAPRTRELAASAPQGGGGAFSLRF